MVGLKKISKRIYIIAFLIALITILVYLPALQNDFVNWDDQDYVYENPHIWSLDFEFFKWMFTTFHASNWHPFTWFSHAIDYAIWGLNPMGHHLTSIIFHGLNTFLVVILIMRLIYSVSEKSWCGVKNQAPLIVENNKQIYNTSIIAAVVTGLLFGLHPLHVESVAWVSERKDVLCAFFFLLSILSYLKYTSSLHPFDKLRAGGIYYSLCLLFFLLALMSKPMTVTLPVVLIILDFYPLERLSLKSVFTFQRKVLIEKLPFMVLSLASSVITVMAQQSGRAIVSLDIHPLGERFLVGIRALCFYLIKMLLPTNLAPLYPYPSKISVFAIEYIGVFILVSSITAFCIYSWRKQKIWSAVWAYYLVILLPVLGIIQVGDQAAANRYAYLPSLAPFLLVGLGVARLIEKPVSRKHDLMFRKLSVIILMTIILVLLSNLTIKQTRIWKDSITLWNSELKIFSNSAYKAYSNRGSVYGKQGNYHMAIKDFNMAININPNKSVTYYNRGLAHERLGNYHMAMNDYNMAINLNPQYAKAYNNRGNIHFTLGDYQQAIQDFDKVIELNPQFPMVYYNRGIAYEDLGDYQQAIEDYNKEIDINPEYELAYNNRGIIYGNLGNYLKAIQDFNIAIKLNSQDSIAYYNRGMAYKMLGDYQQAIKDLQIAARLGDKKAQDYLLSKGIKW